MEFNLYLILYAFIIFFIFTIFRFIIRKIRLSKYNLVDKTFLITGGCQGIGKEIIKILVLQYKCKIINIDIRNDLFEELSQIDKTGTQIINFKCDLSNLEDLSSTCKEIFKKFEKIDFLINNAGIANNTNFDDLKEEEITKLMNINLIAPMKLCKLFTDHYLKLNKIHIITMASVMSHIIADKSSDYISSKWGLYSFHEAMRYDYYYNPNINFTVICPFAVKTGMFPGFTPPLPFIKLLEVEDVARATVDSIILKDKILFIPFYVEFICLIFNFLPVYLRDSLYFSLSTYYFYF